MHMLNKKRKLFAGVAYLLGIALLLAAFWPGFSPASANTALAQGTMQLRLNSITCSGQTVRAIFVVTNAPPASQINNYGSVSYTANGQTRTASFSGRSGNDLFYVDTQVVGPSVSSATVNVTAGSVTLMLNSGSVTLNLSNPGPVVITCTTAGTATPTAVATATSTPLPGGMQLALLSLTCNGQTVTATFQVTNVPTSQVSNYGSVNYTANGQARVANLGGVSGSTAFYVDSTTLGAGVSTASFAITGGTVTLTTSSGATTLNLSNPGTFTVTCAAATAVPTDTPTAVAAAPTDTPTTAPAAVVATSTAIPPTGASAGVATGAPSNIGGAGVPSPSTLPVTGGITSNPAMVLLLVLGLAFVAIGVAITRSARTTRG